MFSRIQTRPMDLLQSLSTSLLSPMVLAFVLGLFATLVKSDLKFPDELYTALTIYLLFAIGLKGGMKLSGMSLSVVGLPLACAVAMSASIPVWCFFILKKIVKLDAANSGAISAHFGSVSAVTFSAVLAFLENGKIEVEGYVPALLAVMEAPAIIVAIYLAMKTLQSGASKPGALMKLLHELITGKGILLLLGGLVIGVLCGKKGFEQVAPFFDAPFKGVLALFLLEVGLVTGRRLGDLKAAGWKLVAFALIMPMLHGLLGALVGKWCGLGLGGATVLATLAASASYIAAPAAVRIALPQASPALYLTTSLAITFPFNIVLGIPMYHEVAKFLFKS
jgi:uncharacterized protein